jgi:hypothetical protein
MIGGERGEALSEIVGIARNIRKSNEKWTDAVRRASAMYRKDKGLSAPKAKRSKSPARRSKSPAKRSKSPRSKAGCGWNASTRRCNKGLTSHTEYCNQTGKRCTKRDNAPKWLRSGRSASPYKSPTKRGRQTNVHKHTGHHKAAMGSHGSACRTLSSRDCVRHPACSWNIPKGRASAHCARTRGQRGSPELPRLVFEEVKADIIIPKKKKSTSQCQGILRKNCTKKNGCVWIPRKTLSNGTKRKGHCRKLKGK